MGSSLARNYCFYQPIKDKDVETVQTRTDQVPNQQNYTESGGQSVFIWHQTQSGDGGDSARTARFYLVNKEADSKTHIHHPQDSWELKGPYFSPSLFFNPTVVVNVHQAGNVLLQISSCPKDSQTASCYCFQSLRIEKCGSLLYPPPSPSLFMFLPNLDGRIDPNVGEEVGLKRNQRLKTAARCSCFLVASVYARRWLGREDLSLSLSSSPAPRLLSSPWPVCPWLG